MATKYDETLLHMIISRIFNNNKYQISYGFTGKFIGKGRYNTLWFLSPLQKLKYVINWDFSAKPEEILRIFAMVLKWYFPYFIF